MTDQPGAEQAGDKPGTYRLYRDLADWWPLISPPDQYAQEVLYLGAVLSSAAAIPVREVLDLGSGGGHVAVHLTDRFDVTLVDISAEMLAVSRRLNPRCLHLLGDMRTVRLDRNFDAVLVHDAVDYVTARDDLARVIQTAYVHCRPGGIAVFVPDYVSDDFQECSGTGGGGSDAAGRQASFTERTWDPDPSDDWVQAEYEFILRGADGAVQVIRETHRLGAFSRRTWLRLLTGAGFVSGAGFAGLAMPGRAPDHLFVAHRPAAQGAQSGTLGRISPHLAGTSGQPTRRVRARRSGRPGRHRSCGAAPPRPA
jgi:SAM-dependent methyltransferase